MAYAPALAVQQATHAAVLAGSCAETLILVEHEPVITVSQRRAAGKHLLASPQHLAQLGIDIQTTDRGGDITYHGPGQLVAYPIIRLHAHGLNLGRYMRLLEQVVMDTVETLGIAAHRTDGCTGVWIGDRKIAALGVRIRRQVTLHGLALNVHPDLRHFDTIVPCGLANKGVTSMRELLMERCPTLEQVKDELIGQMARSLRLTAVTDVACAARRPEADPQAGGTREKTPPGF
jgi:lipoyl(octanoyl) transferase